MAYHSRVSGETERLRERERERERDGGRDGAGCGGVEPDLCTGMGERVRGREGHREWGWGGWRGHLCSGMWRREGEYSRGRTGLLGASKTGLLGDFKLLGSVH